MALEEAWALRPLLHSLAYRLLGRASDAEDVVQEAMIRYHARCETVESPQPFLVTVVIRLCLDELRSARVRRESYPGQWLPEPLPETLLPDPADAAERSESIRFAFLVLLERLMPLQRAVFVLHEAFGYDHAGIAAIVGTTESASRQLLRRARQAIADSRPRFAPSPERQAQLAAAFVRACESGDVTALTQLLTEDATAVADGGGRVPVARQPVIGRERVARYFVGLAATRRPAGIETRILPVNGAAAVVLSAGDLVVGVLCFEFAGDRIARLYSVVNPDKLSWFNGRGWRA